MYILGISCYYHDSAAVIIKDGVLIAAAEEERFSRIKHDSSYPQHAIAFCLEKAGITSVDLSYVVFYEKPFLKFERMFLSSLSTVPHSLSLFRESMKEWFFDKLWIKSHIVSQLHIDPHKIMFSEHHLSHIASAYFCSPYEKAAVLSIDGVGEWTTTTWGIASGNTITLKEEIRFPNSLGLLYSAFTVFAGFEANEGEYKLMGLSPYGTPKYVDKIYKLFSSLPDGSYSLNLNYFSYHYNLRGIYTKKFEDLFGHVNTNPDKVLAYYADIASSIQYVIEEQLIKIANYIYDKTNLDTLCYAGGVALNSKANWQILTKSKFKHLFIQPAAGDAGGALGAALWMYHSVLGRKRAFVMDHAYFGDAESPEEIKATLDSENITYTEIPNEEDLIDQVTDKLEKGQVIGCVRGRFEWGPRALGNRSILADPRSEKMKYNVNKKIKFREAFRPFAPSIRVEDADSYFHLQEMKHHEPFKFMLYVVPVKEKHHKNLGAVTHVDGTARPQLVYKKINNFYHSLIKTFGDKTGVPVVLNTSFNLKGEPIVNTTREALNTYQRSGLDALLVGNFLLEKHSKKRS